MLEQLRRSIGEENVSTSESELYRHSHDESSHQAAEPDVVCFPTSTGDVQKIIEIAQSFHVPVIPYGVGSGLEGQVIPVSGGISINFDQMNHIVDFSIEDMTVTVQPGITRTQLNEKINPHGLQFPIDPGADASIGGMCATNASGTTAVKYGSMRDQVLDLEVVLADGKTIHTGSHAKKSSSGYHLNGLFVGSEGTLGVITEITMKLHGIPEYRVAARCTFQTVDECATAAYTVLLHGVSVKRMELVDKTSIAQVNQYGDYSYPEENSLFFEFAGTKTEVDGQKEKVFELMTDMNCNHWDVAITNKDINHLWKARHEMSLAFRHQRAKSFFGTDICVPISQIPSMVSFARDLLEKSGLKGGILGHIGDGNFHTLVLFDKESEAETKAAIQLNEQLVYRAISLKGTCTGEHGVGLGKRKYQEREHGGALTVMKDIKNLLDPNHILNPGKIFMEKD